MLLISDKRRVGALWRRSKRDSPFSQVGTCTPTFWAFVFPAPTTKAAQKPRAPTKAPGPLRPTNSKNQPQPNASHLTAVTSVFSFSFLDIIILRRGEADVPLKTLMHRVKKEVWERQNRADAIGRARSSRSNRGAHVTNFRSPKGRLIQANTSALIALGALGVRFAASCTPAAC